MNRRGFFSLLAAALATIGVGKVPNTTRRRSPAKSPPVTSYDWKQLHSQVTFHPSVFDKEAERIYRLVEERFEKCYQK